MSQQVPQKRADLGTAYVVTEDLTILVRRWCRSVGIPVGDLEDSFFEDLFENLAQALRKYCFADGTKEVKNLKTDAFNDLLEKHDGLNDGDEPREFWVSLDEVYVTPEVELESKRNISVTRYVNCADGKWKLIGYGPRPEDEATDRTKDWSLQAQVQSCIDLCSAICQKYSKDKLNMFLVDDGTFDGGTIEDLLTRFARGGYNIESVRLGVATTEGVEKIAAWRWPPEPTADRAQHTVPFIGASKLCPPILDWVCERDFFPGVLYSGKVVGEKYGEDDVRPLLVGEKRIPVRAQYLYGWGDDYHWATLHQGGKEFTLEALKLSKELWKHLQGSYGQEILVEHLPAIPYRIFDMNRDCLGEVLKTPWIEVLDASCKEIAEM